MKKKELKKMLNDIYGVTVSRNGKHSNIIEWLLSHKNPFHEESSYIHFRLHHMAINKFINIVGCIENELGFNLTLIRTFSHHKNMYVCTRSHFRDGYIRGTEIVEQVIIEEDKIGNAMGISYFTSATGFLPEILYQILKKYCSIMEPTLIKIEYLDVEQEDCDLFIAVVEKRLITTRLNCKYITEGKQIYVGEDQNEVGLTIVYDKKERSLYIKQWERHHM